MLEKKPGHFDDLVSFKPRPNEGQSRIPKAETVNLRVADICAFALYKVGWLSHWNSFYPGNIHFRVQSSVYYCGTEKLSAKSFVLPARKDGRRVGRDEVVFVYF